MTSNRPYLLRALYEWMVDNGTTPHLVVATDLPGVQVPDGYAAEGRIVLNVSPSAVQDLQIGNEVCSFEGSFRRVPMTVSFPVDAVMAIYPREDPQSMMVFEVELPEFDASEPEEEVVVSEVTEEPVAAADTGSEAGEGKRPSGRPHLKVIK